MVISILCSLLPRIIVITACVRVLLVLCNKFIRILATYWLEHGYLPSLKVVVGLDVFAVIAVEFGEFRRHPLESLVIVFARGRRQSRFRSRVIVRGDGSLNGRHDIWGRLHGEGSRRSSRECLRGAAELLPCVASPPGRARVDLSVPQQFCWKRRGSAKLVVPSMGVIAGAVGGSR
jgi:hypothetical protein